MRHDLKPSVNLADRKSVGARLQGLRKHLDMNQDEMAGVLEISLRGWRNYEAGLRELPASLGFKICNLYAVDPIWLYEGIGPSPAVQAKGGEGVLWREAILLTDAYLERHGIELTAETRVKVYEALVALLQEGQATTETLVGSLVKLAS